MGSSLREIRVHGVSGTTPEALLDLTSADDVERVAGDDVTGFWRRTAKGAATLPPWMLPPPRHRRALGWGVPTPEWDVEAYSWGSLTSGARGSVSRAAWLLLIPFALVNVAAWARPGLVNGATSARGPRAPTFKPDRGMAVVVRLTGLALTGVLVAAAATVSIDMLAYQCFRGGDLLCPSLPSQAHFLASEGWEAPGRRVAIGAVGPLLVLLVLWWLGRVTRQRYEDTPDRSEETDSTKEDSGTGQREPVRYPHLLESTTMWNGRQRWRTLAAWHLIFGLALVLAIVGWVTAEIGHWGWQAWWGVLAGAFLAVRSVLGIVRASDGPEVEGNYSKQPAQSRSEAGIAEGVLLLAAGVTVIYLVWAGASPVAGSDFVDLTPVRVITTVLVALAGVGVVLGIVAWASDKWEWTAVALVVVVFGSAVGALLLPDDWGWWPPAVALTVAVVSAVVLHLIPSKRDRERWAFRGAAPGVMLGGGLFVSLLFTTAVVLGAVVWLTGPSELASMPATYGRPTLCAGHEPDRTDDAPHNDCTRLVAFGDVELVDTRIARTDACGPRPCIVEERLVGGRISVGSLAIAAPEGQVSEAIPSLTVSGDDVTLVVQDDRAVAREDDDPGSREDGTLIVGASPGAQATLTVAEGVLIETRDPPYQGELVVPTAIRTFAVVFPVFLLGAGLVLGAAWIWFYKRTTTDIENRAGADIPEREVEGQQSEEQPPLKEPTDALERRLRTDKKRYRRMPDFQRDRLIRAMTRQRRFGAFARRGEVLLGRVAVVGGAGMFFAIVTALRDLTAEPAELEEWVADVVSAFTAAGMYLAVGAAIGLLALGAAVRRDAAFRRPVGVLWDLSCFWPRVAHPFSPPCYAERAVPDLYERLDYCTRGERRALLSGHSLGSYLAVAAIFRLRYNYDQPDPTGQRANLALLTYGSQLRYYWGRVFPGAFGPQVLGSDPTQRLGMTEYEYSAPSDQAANAPDAEAPWPLSRQLGVTLSDASRWISLYRLTDPLGFTVVSDGPESSVDRPVFEVRLNEPGDPEPPALLGHGGYPSAPEYHLSIRELAGRLELDSSARVVQR